jgi:hypothetical protein
MQKESRGIFGLLIPPSRRLAARFGHRSPLRDRIPARSRPKSTALFGSTSPARCPLHPRTDQSCGLALPRRGVLLTTTNSEGISLVYFGETSAHA